MSDTFSSLYLQDPATAIRLRQLHSAQRMRQEGASAAPVQHWTQGLNRVFQAALGSLDERAINDQMRQQDDQYRAEADQAYGRLRQLMGAGQGGAGTAPTPGATGPQAQHPAAPTMEARSPISNFTPPANMYGRNEPLAAVRDGSLGDGPTQLAALSERRASDAGQPLYNPATTGARSELPGWDAGLPAPTGRVNALLGGSPVSQLVAAATATPSAQPATAAATQGAPQWGRVLSESLGMMGTRNPYLRNDVGRLVALATEQLASERQDRRHAADQQFQLGRDAASRAHAESMARLQGGIVAANRAPTVVPPGYTALGANGTPIYTAPRTGMFSGNSMTAQATNYALDIGPRITAGTATPEEIAVYRRAYTFLRDNPVPQEVPDPSDPSGQRRVMAYIPRDMSDLPPPPPGGQPSPVAAGAAAPGAVPAGRVPVARVDEGSPQRPGPVPGTVAEPPTLTDPNAPRVIPGTARRDAPLTEDQARANMFGIAAQGADRILGQVAIPSAGALAAWRNLPDGVVNLTLNANDQRYFNAVRQFAAGVLRRETGAAFTNQELLDVQTRFFPSPGDSREVIEQKAAARRQVIEALRSTMPGSAFRGEVAPSAAPALPPGFIPVR